MDARTVRWRVLARSMLPLKPERTKDRHVSDQRPLENKVSTGKDKKVGLTELIK